ncbi:NfeD family protein [Paenibacillus sp. YPG26]|uniref:NfeD family protein n=1 Tax=Paenibacillus sp. YPG26 TaxID=2878915 RepID=UPI002040FE95|nr:NfeD family protein [Paenibacillus sp. YPG26]USB33687.1 NfeD family protein [Paenibacillus sp. YPG26]
MHIWVLWLIAAGILLVSEMMTLTFYLLWLSIGAGAAALVAWIAPDNILMQVVIGCAVALVLTVFTKPLVRGFRTSRGFQDIGTELVGKQGIVVEPIDKLKNGIVKIGGDTWTAVSDQFIGVDERVIVVKRGNAILEVERWEDTH